MPVPPSSLTHSVFQSNLFDDISSYSPNERMSLVIQGLVGLAILIVLATIWFMWVTRKSKRVRDDQGALEIDEARDADQAPSTDQADAAVGRSTFVAAIPSYSQPDLPDLESNDADYDISDGAKSSQAVHHDDSVD